MTREEAIRNLDAMWKMLTSAYDEIADSFVLAYSIAVDSLKAQIDKDTNVGSNGDTIYRQDAIDVVKRLMGDYELSRTVQTGLHILPSAQPEPHYDEWCTDCKEYDHERHCCPRWNRVIRETLKDAQPEIIRCRDCKYWREYRYVNGKPKFLPKCGFNDIYVREDDFCSKAERQT